MIPKNSSSIYDLYSESPGAEAGDSKVGVSRVPVQARVVVSRVPDSVSEVLRSRAPVQDRATVSRAPHSGSEVVPSRAPVQDSATVSRAPHSGENREVEPESGGQRDFIRRYPPNSHSYDVAEEDEDTGDEKLKLKRKHNKLIYGDEEDVDDLEEAVVQEEHRIKEELKENQTKRKPHERGVSQLLFVSAITLIVVLIVVSIFKSLIGSAKINQEEKKEEETNHLSPSRDKKQEEIDRLQAMNILANKKRAEENRREKALGTLLNPVSRTGTKENPAPAPESKNEESGSAESTPEAKPSPAPSPALPPPPPQVVVPPPPEAILTPQTSQVQQLQIDYNELRRSAANFGSYGIESSRSGNNPNTPVPPVASTQGWTAVEPEVPASAPRMQTGPQQVVAPPPRQNNGVSLVEAEQGFLSRLPVSRPEPVVVAQTVQIFAGQRVPAVSQSPVYALENFKDDTRYPFLLDGDIMDSNGNTAIPRGTIVMAELTSVQGNIFIMKPVSVILNGREIPIPPGSMDIRGRNQPLIARQVTQGQFKNLRDNALLFLLGGVQSAAELANRATTSTTSSSSGFGGFSTTTTTTTPPPDYGAAAISGALQKVLPKIEAEINNRRNVQQGEAKIYQLNEGTSVNIYVVKGFSL